MLASAATGELLQMVSRWNAQVIQGCRSIQDEQLPVCAPGELEAHLAGFSRLHTFAVWLSAKERIIAIIIT